MQHFRWGILAFVLAAPLVAFAGDPPAPPAKQPAQTDESKLTVYRTTSGKKYHSKDCKLMQGNGTPITLKEAKEKGLDACSRCHGRPDKPEQP